MTQGKATGVQLTRGDANLTTLVVDCQKLHQCDCSRVPTHEKTLYHQPSEWERVLFVETPGLHHRSPDSSGSQIKSKELKGKFSTSKRAGGSVQGGVKGGPQRSQSRCPMQQHELSDSISHCLSPIW